MYECVQTIEKRDSWKQLVDRDDSLHQLGLHAQISQGFLLRPSMLFCFVGFFSFWLTGTCFKFLSS